MTTGRKAPDDDEGGLDSSRYESTRSEETDWVVQATAGDDGAFRCLVERHEGTVYRIALRLLKDPDQAAEAAQDAFIKAHRGLSRFESRSKFSTWMYRITMNVCYDRLSKKSGPRSMALEELAEQGLEPRADSSWNPNEEMDRTESERVFELALEALSETYRLPFVLRQIEERSYDEIAEVLEISVANAKVRVHRAREMMVAWLRKSGAL